MSRGKKIRRSQIVRACEWLRLEAPAFAERAHKTFALWERRWFGGDEPPSLKTVQFELDALINGVASNAQDTDFDVQASRAGFSLDIHYFSGRVYARLDIEERLYRDVTDPEPTRCPTCDQVVASQESQVGETE